jgi:hypothetical protein
MTLLKQYEDESISFLLPPDAFTKTVKRRKKFNQWYGAIKEGELRRLDYIITITTCDVFSGAMFSIRHSLSNFPPSIVSWGWVDGVFWHLVNSFLGDELHHCGFNAFWIPGNEFALQETEVNMMDQESEIATLQISRDAVSLTKEDIEFWCGKVLRSVKVKKAT